MEFYKRLGLKEENVDFNLYDYFKKKPYEGTKIIFFCFSSIRENTNLKIGPEYIKEPNLKHVDYGYYEIGDGGSTSRIMVGKLTHEELLDILHRYPEVPYKYHRSDVDAPEIYECFQFDSDTGEITDLLNDDTVYKSKDSIDRVSSLYWILYESEEEITKAAIKMSSI